MTSSRSLLAADFPTISYGEWRRRVEAELGEVSFERALQSTLSDDLVRQPLYTAGDLPGDDPAGFPGLPPYVRGALPVDGGWMPAQEVRGAEDVRACGPESGVGLVWVDPRTSALGELLSGLDLSRVAVGLGAGTGVAAPVLVAEASRQSIAADELRGCFGCDPLGVLAARGCLPGSLRRAFELAADLVAWSARRAPGIRALLVDLAPYHDAGAEPVEELAFLAASGVEVLRWLTTGIFPPRLPATGDLGVTRRAGKTGLDVDKVAGELLFAVSVGGDFFVEIAKLRAARLLWAKVVRASGGSGEAQKMRLHARTSSVTRTVRDPWVNLVRGAAESFAAAVGGADSIVTAPFDAPLGRSDDSSRRLAVNTQHILREEAYVDRTLDPAGGSYMVERLTDELARAAWALFREVERRGGMARCLRDGWVRERIAATAQKRQRAVDRHQVPIVGTSVFPDLGEDPPKRPAREAHDSPGSLRPRSDDFQRRLAELANTTVLSPVLDDSMLDAAVAAVEAGASLAELSATVWRGTEPASVEALPAFRPARPFEEMRDRSDRWREAHGRRPRVFLAQIGEPREYRGRSGFASSFFAAGGIEGIERGGFAVGADLARAVAEAFVESGAELAVLCSTDETYTATVPKVAAALKERGARAIALAGRPGGNEEAYRNAGVSHFLYQGCDTVAVLQACWEALGETPWPEPS